MCHPQMGQHAHDTLRSQGQGGSEPRSQHAHTHTQHIGRHPPARERGRSSHCAWVKTGKGVRTTQCGRVSLPGRPLPCLCAWSSPPEQRDRTSLDLPRWALATGQDFHTWTFSTPGLEAPGRSLPAKLCGVSSKRRKSRGVCVCVCVCERKRAEGKETEQKYFGPGPLRWGSWWARQPPRRLVARVKWGRPLAQEPPAPSWQGCLPPPLNCSIFLGSHRPLLDRGPGGPTGSDKGTSPRPEDVPPCTWSPLLLPTLFAGDRMGGARAGPG